jgi:AcrR family transcriptional regulator
MVQSLKPHVRQAILGAAANVFAEAGYEGATLSSIATRARTSVGNLYKYFTNKDELFAAAVPPKLVREIGALLRRRVEALGVAVDVNAVGASHPYHLASEELLEFTLAHRPELRFLLGRAEGTAFASFREDLVTNLTKLALGYASRAYPSAKITASRRRALARIYRAFMVSIASILANEKSDRALREAIAHHSTYHLAGLRAFIEAARPSRRRMRT